MITFDELTRLEPRLMDVLNSVRAARPIGKIERRRFNYEHQWNDFRGWIEELVGWHRDPPDPVLSSSEAWHVAFARLEEEFYRK